MATVKRRELAWLRLTTYLASYGNCQETDTCMVQAYTLCHLWQLSRDGNLHGSGMSQARTASPKPSFISGRSQTTIASPKPSLRAPWRVGDLIQTIEINRKNSDHECVGLPGGTGDDLDICLCTNIQGNLSKLRRPYRCVTSHKQAQWFVTDDKNVQNVWPRL